MVFRACGFVILLFLGMSVPSWAHEATSVPSLPKVRHIIDTHIHLYDTNRPVYKQDHPDNVPWPPVNDDVLHHPHMPDEYKAASKPAGVTGVVIVEASPRIDDNRWVLDLVKDDDFFVGLVGNIDAFSDKFGAQLESLKKDPRFVGVRVHLMKKGSTVSENELLLNNLRLLAKSGLSVDVLMNGEGPQTIAEVSHIASQIPDLRMVCNHVLGYRVDGEMPAEAWTTAVKELATRPNVSIKISGLYQMCTTQPASQDVRHYDEVLDVLWNAFGSDRLIYGSNWPCTKKSGDYASFVRLVNAYFADKGQEVSEKFFWQNAVKAYGLKLK